MLVPMVMERELLRHFVDNAEKIATKATAAHDEYLIQKLYIPVLPSKNDFKAKFIEEMKHQWSSFKEHFIVENLPIVGNLEDVLDWYFEIIPPFSEKN